MKHDKSKSVTLDVSHKLYERSLIFYPTDLRRDFGGEMIEVFDEQIAEAYYRSGFVGLLRVWFGAGWETITVGLRGRLARAIPIIAAAATLVFMLWFATYIGYVMETACPGCGH